MASLYDLFKLAAPPQPVNPYNSGRPVRQLPAPIPPPHVSVHVHVHKKSLRHPKSVRPRASKTFGRMVLVPMPEHLVKDYQSGRAVRLDQNTAMNLALQHATQQMQPQHPVTPTPPPLPFGAQQGPLPGAMPGMHPPGMMTTGMVSPQPGMMPRNLLPGGPVPFGARMPG